MPKDTKNEIQTPSGGAPQGDGFFDKASVEPPADTRPGIGDAPKPKLRFDGTPVAGEPAPDLKPAPSEPRHVVRELADGDPLPKADVTSPEGRVALAKFFAPTLSDEEAASAAAAVVTRRPTDEATVENFRAGLVEALDGKRTPEEWARELGHVDGASFVADGEDGAPAARRGAVPLRRRPMKEAKAWVFAAVKRHTGWGTKLPIDVRISRADYEEAVAEALGTPIGPGRERLDSGRGAAPAKPKTKRALKWRADVVIAAKAAEAAKAGGER